MDVEQVSDTGPNVSRRSSYKTMASEQLVKILAVRLGEVNDVIDALKSQKVRLFIEADTTFGEKGKTESLSSPRFRIQHATKDLLG